MASLSRIRTLEEQAMHDAAERAAVRERRERAPSRTLVSVPANGARQRAEREAKERDAAREARLERERRLDQYRQTVFTPSGRPLESLPLATMEEVRSLSKQNRRAMGGLRF